MRKAICALVLLALLSAAQSCSIVDSKYYDRLARNGTGGGRDEDAGEDPDAQIDAAATNE
jgi:hypothetical protein